MVRSALRLPMQNRWNNEAHGFPHYPCAEVSFSTFQVNRVVCRRRSTDIQARLWCQESEYLYCQDGATSSRHPLIEAPTKHPASRPPKKNMFMESGSPKENTSMHYVENLSSSAIIYFCYIHELTTRNFTENGRCSLDAGFRKPQSDMPSVSSSLDPSHCVCSLQVCTTLVSHSAVRLASTSIPILTVTTVPSPLVRARKSPRHLLAIIRPWLIFRETT